MNCTECEQLFDAYLDGHLAGSLRLEFDSHRLRCHRCQQTLAMLETIGNVVVAGDPQAPELSADFTSRVMRQVATQRRRSRPRWRIALVGGALLQAAAVLGFAFLWNRQPAPTATPIATMTPEPRPRPAELDPDRQALRQLVIDRVEQRLYDMQAAGQTLTGDFADLARYLDIHVTDQTARDSVQLAETSPWDWIWRAIVPAAAEEPPDAESTDVEVHSL